MSIDTKLITKLRELTGAGIADCKIALEEVNGNLDQAVETLRKKGAVKAAKKAERSINEGVIAFNQVENKIAVVGLACETDFVAKNQDFINTVNDFAKKLLTTKQVEFEDFAREKIQNELMVKIGENIKLIFAEIISGELIGAYLHANKKVAAVVVLNAGKKELATDLAMQVTAMSPRHIKPQDIPVEELEKEKEIYRQQLKNEGKSEAMWEKIIPGKLNKFYEEVCLLNQPFIKDDKIKIIDLIKQESKNTGQEVVVISFKRYQI